MQHLFITVANWLDRDHDLLFVKSCNFKFLPTDPKQPKLIGKRIISVRHNSFDYFENYHGIKYTFIKSKKSYEIYKILLEQLSLRRPVIINLDAFWTSWNAYGYQKIHDSHYCLVIGVNQSEKFFYCLDPIYSMQVLKLSFRDFYNGSNRGCGIFEKQKYKSLEVKLIINEINRSLKENDTHSLDLLSKEIINFFDLDNEVLGFSRACDAPINNNLVKLAFSRHYLARGLLYLAHHTHIHNHSYMLHEISEYVKRSADLWQIVHNVMCKSHYKFQTEKVVTFNTHKIAGKIKQISENEQAFKLKLDDLEKQLF
ncbi:hypothetical protein ACFVVQ_03900 [Paenibacillus chitinolyticus]|uniref:hypothetical protein n=1 Tax=Paenibacillus chitinolyticus TaxID=79263 RepID=UPI0036DA5185